MKYPSKKKLPKHLAIIMDGNGRWAEKRSMNRIVGHEHGIKAARRIVKACRDIGIPVLTLYTFSKENWERPKKEVNALMKLLERYLYEVMDEIDKHDARLMVIGDIADLPARVVKALNVVAEKTKKKKKMVLNLALSYGGRAEITRAVKMVIEDYEKKTLTPSKITPALFSKYLYTKGLPDPDLLIRTGGEFRLSNFLLWQTAYTEIYVTKVLWPDFSRAHLIRALSNYQKRERRFGRTVF